MLPQYYDYIVALALRRYATVPPFRNAFVAFVAFLRNFLCHAASVPVRNRWNMLWNGFVAFVAFLSMFRPVYAVPPYRYKDALNPIPLFLSSCSSCTINPSLSIILTNRASFEHPSCGTFDPPQNTSLILSSILFVRSSSYHIRHSRCGITSFLPLLTLFRNLCWQ